MRFISSIQIPAKADVFPFACWLFRNRNTRSTLTGKQTVWPDQITDIWCLLGYRVTRPAGSHDRNKLKNKLHLCPILWNRFHPTKQHSICYRSENCVSLAICRRTAVDSIDSFDLSNGKVYYLVCGRRSDNCISLSNRSIRSIGGNSYFIHDLIHDSTLKVVEPADTREWRLTNVHFSF